jgi:deoxyribonuclease IV
MKIGAHVSIAGGIENAPKNAKDLNCECFQMFSRSPRGGNHKKINQKTIEEFFANCQQYGFDVGKDYVIHSPYFINLASPNNRIYHGSVSALREELKTANLIRCPFVITHIGSSKDLEEKNRQEQINSKVVKAIKKIHENYQGNATLVLEIAAGSGNIVGDTFKEISFFIKESKKENINLGFCLDTCHAFAAGYDLRTPEKAKEMFSEIDKKIGLDYLKCIHFNDSQTELRSRIDRHEHIGQGKIGSKGLKEVAKIAKKLNSNLYLETKHDKIEKDLKLTKSFIN